MLGVFLGEHYIFGSGHVAIATIAAPCGMLRVISLAHMGSVYHGSFNEQAHTPYHLAR
jgi:hypothetical protein